MPKNYSGEKWKTVKFDIDFTNDMTVEVSNFGRVRTFNKIADGKFLNGSTVNGYKQITFKLFKPKTKTTQTRFDYFRKQISKLTLKISATKKRINGKRNADNVIRKYKRELKEEQSLLDLIKKKYRKEFRDDERKRTMNKSFFVHKLVAEYFCKKPSDNHTLVIHLDHKKLNNKWSNLMWTTQDEVTEHQKHSPHVKAVKGNRKGKRVNNAKHYKLTETRVALIKKRINEGKPLRIIAKRFKVTETQILRIKRGINWGNVKAAN